MTTREMFESVGWVPSTSGTEKEIIERWDRLGFLEGEPKSRRKRLAFTLEGMAQFILKANETNDPYKLEGCSETLIYPLLRRIMTPYRGDNIRRVLNPMEVIFILNETSVDELIEFSKKDETDKRRKGIVPAFERLIHYDGCHMISLYTLLRGNVMTKIEGITLTQHLLLLEAVFNFDYLAELTWYIARYIQHRLAEEQRNESNRS